MWSKVVTLLVMMLFVQFGVIAWVYLELKRAQDSIVSAKRTDCENSKLDRRDISRFQRAQTKYIKDVSTARSIEPKVIRAAREARKVFVVTSTRLTTRSKINCKEAIP